ncbi:MAG: hypothetical protein MI745_06685 [Pseudomonadales bacterium]|nr:hypothetical protein [Pseudomonadales bacterium]
MGGAALALGGNALQGATSSAPAYSGSDGEQNVATGSKDFNFGNPNKGLYRQQASWPMWLALAAVAALLIWFLVFKKK